MRETWESALAAAFDDYRFPPLTAAELPEVRFSVTVLGELEPVVSHASLDPAVYGVVVAAVDGRKGVLLPAIAGIDSVKQQLAIARQKAGIEPEEWVKLQRFRAKSYKETQPGRGGGGACRLIARAPPAIRPAGGCGGRTGGWNAGFARASASCRAASAVSALSGSGSATRWCSTTYGRSSGFCVDPIEKNPSTIFCPARACCRSARRAATWAASSARTGISARRGSSTGWATPRRPNDRRDGPAPRLPLGGVHLQRPGDFRRIRHRRRRGPATTRASRPLR